MTDTKYTLLEDPGHAWLGVQRTELVELGIAHKITGYSYVEGELVWLEEDCDLAAFVEARAAAAGYTTREGAQKFWRTFSKDSVNVIDADRDSYVRNLPRYTFEGVTA